MPKATYRTFLKKHFKAGSTNVADIYHAVRNIPYGSTGERDPVKVIANNLGSCSGKHILLRDLLREVGREAEVITMFTHFNRGIPSHPAMPAELRAMIDRLRRCAIFIITSASEWASVGTSSMRLGTTP